MKEKLEELRRAMEDTLAANLNNPSAMGATDAIDAVDRYYKAARENWKEHSEIEFRAKTFAFYPVACVVCLKEIGFMRQNIDANYYCFPCMEKEST